MNPELLLFIGSISINIEVGKFSTPFPISSSYFHPFEEFYVSMWVFPKIGGKPPKSSILIGFSIINHPFWGTPIFGNTHVFVPHSSKMGISSSRTPRRLPEAPSCQRNSREISDPVGTWRRIIPGIVSTMGTHVSCIFRGLFHPYFGA